MATWQEMSRSNLEASKQLAGQEQWRSSVSRYYYSAYCALTGELTAKGLTFSHGWNNPAHEQLPELISNNMALPQNTTRRFQKVIRILRRAREDADYRPSANVDRAMALDAIRSAIIILKGIGNGSH